MNKEVLKQKKFWIGLALALAPLFPAAQSVLNEEVLGQVVALIVTLGAFFSGVLVDRKPEAGKLIDKQ